MGGNADKAAFTIDRGHGNDTEGDQGAAAPAWVDEDDANVQVSGGIVGCFCQPGTLCDNVGR